ncbi:MAG TPA: hypothetical protein VFP55_10445, partial [Solirubrobacteraceae bacterium]|nr:hypothetical protein [Solirubrobacteraceae bacterium]
MAVVAGASGFKDRLPEVSAVEDVPILGWQRPELQQREREVGARLRDAFLADESTQAGVAAMAAL